MDDIAEAFMAFGEVSHRAAASLEKVLKAISVLNALEGVKEVNRPLYRRYTKSKSWRKRKKAEKEILKLYDDMHVQALRKAYDERWQVTVK